MYMMILYCLMQIIKIFILPTYKIIKRIKIKKLLTMTKEDKIFLD